MEISLKFAVPDLPEDFLIRCGLKKLDFTHPDTRSCRAFRILSLFVGQTKHSFTRTTYYYNYAPYNLVDDMKTYMARVLCNEEWEVQLLTAMILHTTRYVSDVKVEETVRRLASRTSEGTREGRFDLSYKSKKGLYLIELKMLGESDFKANEQVPIELWEIRKTDHIRNKLFSYDIDAIKTVKDTLDWATVQAATYVTEEKVEEYAGIVVVSNRDILFETRIEPVYDLQKKNTAPFNRNDFSPAQCDARRKQRS